MYQKQMDKKSIYVLRAVKVSLTKILANTAIDKRCSNPTELSVDVTSLYLQTFFLLTLSFQNISACIQTYSQYNRKIAHSLQT